MSACCVSGCKNRHSATNQLKFYRIPIGKRPFQAKRRRLWLQALEQVNGSSEGLKGNVRVCGAHFVSGQASMDHDSPDFVPSVFTCTKPSPKKKGRGRKQQRKANVKHEDVLMETESELSEETKTTPAQVPKEEGTWAKESETSTKLSTSQTTSSPSKSSVSYKLPPGISKLDKMSPFVLIKPLHLPAGNRNELDNRSFNVSELGKGKQLKKEEKSFFCENCGKQFPCQIDFSKHQCDSAKEPHFPCNICDRYFNTSQKLKRHKLLHVKDGRKCTQCGVLFCRRHNHILFQPKVEPITQSGQDSPDTKSENVGSDVMAKNPLQQESEQSQSGVLVFDTQSTVTTTSLLTSTDSSPSLNPAPLSKTSEAPPPAHTKTVLGQCNVTMYCVPVLIKPLCVQPPPPVASLHSKPGTSFQFVPPQPDEAVTPRLPSPPPIPELPDSLKLFSPQYLTSALLEVKRNYDYILNYPKDRKCQKKEIRVKEENCEWPLTTPDEQVKKKTAYDLEIQI